MTFLKLKKKEKDFKKIKNDGKAFLAKHKHIEKNS